MSHADTVNEKIRVLNGEYANEKSEKKSLRIYRDHIFSIRPNLFAVFFAVSAAFWNSIAEYKKIRSVRVVKICLLHFVALHHDENLKFDTFYAAFLLLFLEKKNVCICERDDIFFGKKDVVTSPKTSLSRKSSRQSVVNMLK